VECTAHYLAIGLPHSDDIFVMAFPSETTEAFLEGHVQAFAYWGGKTQNGATSLRFSSADAALTLPPLSRCKLGDPQYNSGD
jgi:hypothetical protein